MTDVTLNTVGIKIDPKPAQKGGKQVEDSLTRVEKRAGGVKRALISAFAGISVAAVVREFTQIGDQATSLQARLGLVSDSTAELTHTQEELLNVATRTRSELVGTTDLYIGLANALKEADISSREILTVTETINNAFRISGATTSERTNAIRQLNQAMQSGVLRGDEFNSIAENGVKIMDLLATELNVTRGALRDMAAEGKLTTEVLTNAFLNQSETISAEAEKLPTTVGEALTNVRNRYFDYVAGVNESYGITEKLAGVVSLVADNFEKLAGALALVVKTAALLAGARAFGGLVALFTASSASVAGFTVKLTLAQRAMIATSRAATALKGAMALIGGPVGVAALAAYGLYQYATSSGEAGEITKRLRQETDDLVESFENLPLAIANAEFAQVRNAYSDARQELVLLNSELDAFSNEDDFQAIENQKAVVRELGERVEELKVRLRDMRQEQDKSADSTKTFTGGLLEFLDNIKGISDGLIELSGETETFASNMDDAVSATDEFNKLTQQYETRLQRINRTTGEAVKTIGDYLVEQNFSNEARLKAIELLKIINGQYRENTTVIDEVAEKQREMAESYELLIDRYDREIDILNASGDARDRLIAAQELERQGIEESIVGVEAYANMIDNLVGKYDELSEAQQRASYNSGIQGAFGSLFGGDFDGFLSGFDSVLNQAADNFGDAIVQGFQDGFANGGGVSGGASGALGGAGDALSAVPVIGWIYAGMRLNDRLFNDGWRANDAEFTGFGEITGSATLLLDRTLQALGLSERVASLLSGSAIHAYLFGRKAPEIEQQGFRIGTGGDGFSGESFANLVREGGVFRSDRRYTETGELSESTTNAFNEVMDLVNEQLQAVSERFGTGMGEIVEASFEQVYDAEGELIDSFSTFFGRVYKESAEQFASRLASESTIAYLDTLIEQVVGSLDIPDDLGGGGSGGGGPIRGDGRLFDDPKNAALIGQVTLAAEAYRQTSESLAEFTEAATGIVHAMVEGEAIFEMFADNLAITEELANAGETLNQTWSRLLTQNQLITESTRVMGVNLELNAEQLTRFSDATVQALGGLPQAAQAWETYLSGFYTQQELTAVQLERFNDEAATLNAELGTNLTFDTFRTAFEEAMPNLTPEEVATWLRLGGALTRANDAANELVESSLDEAMSNLAGIATELADSQLTLYERLRESGAAVWNLITAYDGSIAAENRIADAVQSRYELELQYLAQIQSAQESINALLTGSVEDIRLSQMTDEEKYDYLSGQAESRAATINELSDPQEIQRVIQEINNYQRQAWGLLDEGQQAEMADGFIEFLDGVNSIAQERLSALETETTTETDRLLTQLEGMFTASQAVDAENQAKFAESVEVQRKAAVMMEQAAAMMQNINVNVNVNQERFDVGQIA